jgi:hypothetical protein
MSLSHMALARSISLEESIDTSLIMVEYLCMSMVNSSVSMQWFCDKNAMKALKVHGGGETPRRMSVSVGGLTLMT